MPRAVSGRAAQHEDSLLPGRWTRSRKGGTGREARKRPRGNMAAAASRNPSFILRPLRWPLGANTPLRRRFASSASRSESALHPGSGTTLSGRGSGAQRSAGRGRPAMAGFGRGGDRRAIAIHSVHPIYSRLHRHRQTSLCSRK